ncbi:MAG: ferredoxin domain-containing protein [Candidatus Geothermincolia bacterium]
MEKCMREYQENRAEAAKLAAKLILASATTAPRVGGIDEITIHMIEDRDSIEEMAILVDKMSAENDSWDFFRSDAVQIRDSDVVLVISDRRSGVDPMDSNCNLCGQTLCDWFKNVPKLEARPGLAFTGPFCLLRSMNMAYALNGAVCQARDLGIDHAVKMSVGAAALRMGLVPYRSGIALGMLLSVTEKNPFKDLPREYADYNSATLENRLVGRLFPTFRSIYS